MEPINELTAEPLLRLMIARAGHEVSEASLADVWPVFKLFATLPSTFAYDSCSFQVQLTREHGMTPTTSIQLVRELRTLPRDERDRGLRRIGFDETYESLGPEGDQELFLWSDEFPSMDAFLAAVEATEQLRRGFLCMPVSGGLFQEYGWDE